METLSFPEPIDAWQIDDVLSINVQGQVTIH